jgi:hypothetical protein
MQILYYKPICDKNGKNKLKKNVSRIRKKTFYLQYIIGLLDNLTKNQEFQKEVVESINFFFCCL